MSYTVHTSGRTAIVIDVVQGDDKAITKGLLLSIEGNGQQITNCTIIPAKNIGALIATLELAKTELEKP